MTFGKICEASHGSAWSKTSANGNIFLENILQERGESKEYVKYITEQIQLQKNVLAL